MAPLATLPPVPALTATTPTLADVHGAGEIGAVATRIVWLVAKPIPVAVETTDPPGMVWPALVSQFRKVTEPLAFVWTTRLPVAGNSPEAVKSRLSRVAGMTPPVASMEVASGSARTVNVIGPIGAATGVTTTVAWGSTT